MFHLETREFKVLDNLVSFTCFRLWPISSCLLENISVNIVYLASFVSDF